MNKTPPINISPNDVLSQIVKGVHHLHLLKIVHGDLKPSNVLVSFPKGDLGPMVKVADFGLCHHGKDSDSKEQQFLPACTEGWMCPSDPIDEKGKRSYSFDIFPLALLFGFVALKGVHPYGSNLDEAISRIKNQQPIALTVGQVHQSFRHLSFLDLLRQMLSYDATKRPTTSDILAHPFFKIEMIISVLHHEEEVSHHLSVSTSTTTTTSRNYKAAVDETQPDIEDISQSVFVPRVTTVSGSNEQFSQSSHIPEDGYGRYIFFLYFIFYACRLLLYYNFISS